MEIVDAQASYDNPLNWTSSVDFGGSPGREGSSPGETVVINEVLASAAAPAGDRIELYNTSSRPMDVSGWYISNTDQDYFRSRWPASPLLPAGGYLVISQTALGFGLDGARGDRLWLIGADAAGRPTVFVDQIQFEPTATDMSLGRFPDGSGSLAVLSHATFGAANAPVRISEVVLSEVHFRPQDPDGPRQLKADDFEFLELYNRTDQPVDVSGWRIAGTVQFTLPAGATIKAHQSLVIVPFRPDDVGKANVFRFFLNSDVTLPLYGPYVGKLDDQANVLRLEQAEVSPPDAPGTTVYVFMDGLQFTVQPPWPEFDDAAGQSLTRVRDSVLGADRQAWVARMPSPGTTDLPPSLWGDVNEDGLFDQGDIELMLQGHKYLTGLPATWREGDWNGDGVFGQLDVVELLQAGSWGSL